MKLSNRQKMQLVELGYAVVPAVVPQIMIKEALKAINHSIGKGIPENHRGANYCKELERDSVITDMYNKTPLKAIVDSLVGEESYYPIGSAQIALRFPSYFENQDPYLGAHLDGVLKVGEGTMQNFTSLVGILVSDQPEPDMGNFTVYPGSHRLYEQYFKENGADVLLTEEAFRTKHRSMNVKLPDPVQITGKAGDVVISHYQLVHAGGINTSDRIRYSCYYRISNNDIRKDWRAPLVDMWKHWPGLHDVLKSQVQS